MQAGETVSKLAYVRLEMAAQFFEGIVDEDGIRGEVSRLSCEYIKDMTHRKKQICSQRCNET